MEWTVVVPIMGLQIVVRRTPAETGTQSRFPGPLVSLELLDSEKHGLCAAHACHGPTKVEGERGRGWLVRNCPAMCTPSYAASGICNKIKLVTWDCL